MTLTDLYASDRVSATNNILLADNVLALMNEKCFDTQHTLTVLRQATYDRYVPPVK